MISAVDKVTTLEKIKDHYHDIQLITMHCCSDISTEAIPDMISQRAELMNLIGAEERYLTSDESEYANDPSEQKIRDEIRSIIDTIVSLDVQVEQIIKSHLQRIKKELAVLSKTSKAVSAYTIQSRV
jgi:hypothetical protein